MGSSCMLHCGDPCSANDSIDKTALKKWKNVQEKNKKIDTGYF